MILETRLLLQQPRQQQLQLRKKKAAVNWNTWHAQARQQQEAESHWQLQHIFFRLGN
jgi:hypothetical protein